MARAESDDLVQRMAILTLMAAGVHDAELTRAWRALLANDLDKAERHFLQTEVHTNEAEASRCAGLGWSLFRRGDLIGAQQAFSRVLTLETGVADAYDGLGWSRFRENRIEDAEMAFRRAVALDRFSAHSWDGLGWCALTTQKPPQARRHFAMAVLCAPLFADAWQGLAMALDDGRPKQLTLALSGCLGIRAHDVRFSDDWPKYGEDWMHQLELARHTDFLHVERRLIQYRKGSMNIAHGRDRAADLRFLYQCVFAQLGWPLSDEECTYQLATVKCFPRPLTAADVRGFERWMQELMRLCRERRTFDGNALQVQVDHHWRSLFYHLPAFGSRPAWEHLCLSGYADWEKWRYLLSYAAKGRGDRKA